MQTREKQTRTEPHSPLMAEIKASKLKEAIGLTSNENETILNCYINYSNDFIELIKNKSLKELEQCDSIITAMYQHHLMLYLNLKEHDDSKYISYIENSNAIIELFFNETVNESPQCDIIMSAMFQQHTILLLNLTEGSYGKE